MKLNGPFNTPLYKQSLHNTTKNKRLIYIDIYRTTKGTEAIHKNTAVNNGEANKYAIAYYYQNTWDPLFSLGERNESHSWDGASYILGV